MTPDGIRAWADRIRDGRELSRTSDEEDEKIALAVELVAEVCERLDLLVLPDFERDRRTILQQAIAFPDGSGERNVEVTSLKDPADWLTQLGLRQSFPKAEVVKVSVVLREPE